MTSEDTNRAVGEDASLAMKIEPHENGPLFVEMNFYIRAAQPSSVEEFQKARKLTSFGMPCLRGNGSHVYKDDKYRFLVMDRFGKDLQKVFQTGKKRFSDQVTYNLAIKIIDVLEYIHSKGYAHNDIKAQNLLMGYGRTKENDVYLVDFGLVSKYHREGVHNEYKPDARKAHDGTIEYTSRDAHIGAHSRRSDLEILGYNLVHWMSGDLPWMDVLTDPKAVQAQKNEYLKNVGNFLARCFNSQDYPDVLETFLDYVVKLEFDTTPDYDKCRKMFSDALKNANYPLDGKIDFASPKKAKKVGRTSGRTSIPVKRKSSSSPIKRKPAAKAAKSKQTAEISSDEDYDDDDDSFEVSKPSPKKSKSKTPAKKISVKSPAKKTITNKAVMKDQGCQTSPAFVKAADKAKKQRKALSAKASSATANNPEMEEFAEMAINSAKKVSARGKKKSTAAASEAADASEVENNFGMENPTPAMLALMAKKAEANSAKKSKATKNKK